MDASVAQSYQKARSIARSRARNFYFGICLLPRERRDALCAIYAFMREADDIADGQGSVAERQRLLAHWRQVLVRTLEGDCSGSLISPAFRHAATKYQIPAEYFHELISGAEMDLTIRSYRTFDELRQYCYRVASVVGLCSLQVFGFRDPAAKSMAEDCGIAFQLTNILRDVREDVGNGRLYLPLDEMQRFQVEPATLASGRMSSQLLELLHFEAARAREYYERSSPLLELVDAESRPALWTMTAIYRGLLERIDRDPAAVFRSRVGLPLFQKMSYALRGAGMILGVRLGFRSRGVRRWQPLT